MNLKIRIKNPAFWGSIVVSILAPILAYFGLTAADLNTWAAVGQVFVDAIANPYVVFLVLASIYNTLIDPTTPGIKDSLRALGYDIPGGKKVVVEEDYEAEEEIEE